MNASCRANRSCPVVCALAVVMTLFLLKTCSSSQVSFVREGKLKLIDTVTREMEYVPASSIPKGVLRYPTWIDHNRVAFLYAPSKKKDEQGHYRVGIFSFATKKLSWVPGLTDVASIGWDPETESVVAERQEERSDGSVPTLLLSFKLSSGKITSRILYQGEKGELDYCGKIEAHRIVRFRSTPCLAVGVANHEPSDLFTFFNCEQSHYQAVTDVLLGADSLFSRDEASCRTMPNTSEFACSRDGSCCVTQTDYEKLIAAYVQYPGEDTWKLVYEKAAVGQILSPGFSCDSGKLVFEVTSTVCLTERLCPIYTVDLKSGGKAVLLCKGRYPQFRPQ